MLWRKKFGKGDEISRRGLQGIDADELDELRDYSFEIGVDGCSFPRDT